MSAYPATGTVSRRWEAQHHAVAWVRGLEGFGGHIFGGGIVAGATPEEGGEWGGRMSVTRNSVPSVSRSLLAGMNLRRIGHVDTTSPTRRLVIEFLSLTIRPVHTIRIRGR